MATPEVSLETSENEFSYEQNKAPYRVWRILTTYASRTGDLMMICTNGAHQIMKTVESPYGWKKVFFFAERAGEWPAIPDPEQSNEFQGRPETDITFHSPELEADGVTWVYRAEAVYYYALLQPVEISDGKMLVGGTPFAGTPQQSVPPGILDASLAP